MIERHWDGIAAYCRPENKVALSFVEGLNNKIRVIQRRACGLHDEEYLKLKVLTCTLPCFQCQGTNGKGPGFDELAGKEGKGIIASHAMG